MTDHMTAAIEAGAKAMADDWNPGRDPILTAMFRDYSASAIQAALPHVRAMIAQEILERLPESGPHINMTQYREGILDGMNRAARIAKGPQQ